MSASSVSAICAIFGRIGFRHFLRAVAQAHDARRGALDQRLGQRKECVAVAVLGDGVGKIVVELLRDVSREFEMLLLVVANRDMGRAIDQNVGRHQHRIIVKPNGSVLTVLAGLLLELRHPVEPA